MTEPSSSMQLVLLVEEDLKVYMNKVLDINAQLSWVAQAMPVSFSIVNTMLDILLANPLIQAKSRLL